MTFKEAMEHYRAGTATEAERQLVEQELEKSQLIAEFLDAQWDEAPLVPAPPAEEMKQVRKTLRRQNALLVVTSIVLVAALLLGTCYIGIPAAEKLYWDPADRSYGTPAYSDLELMLAAYTELFCPDISIAGVSETKTGFAAYDISIRYWNAHRGGDPLYASAAVEKGELELPDGLLQHCAVNIFDRATYPFYPADESRQQNVTDKLSSLPDYVRVVAAVSFPEDKSMAQLLEFQDSLTDGGISWAGIRTSPLEEQMLPLCGMNITQFGIVRDQANDAYPCLEMKGAEDTAENLETHFKSLLRFSADQASAGTGINQLHHRECYYTQVLEYVEENGIYSYGCYVSGTPETFLALIESGAVSQVWIEDIWIGF